MALLNPKGRRLNPNGFKPKPTPKTVAINIRIPESMAEAINKALENHPVEFRTAADFHRTALKNELKRRGLM